MKKVFLFLILLFTLPSVSADETTPLIVWQDSGDLSVWRDSNIQTFVIGNLIFPYLSPSGEQVALVRGQYPYPHSLSIIAIDGEGLRDIGIIHPRQVIWQSETLLWVNSYMPPTEGRLELPLSTMLYRVDLVTDTITEWDMGEAFMMMINPNGDWMALSFAGVYGQRDGHISLLSLIEDSPIPQEIITFPAISSGSHGGYYPSVQWITETSARFAIPEPNAVYILGDVLPQTQLWQVTIGDSTSILLGDIHTPLYPAPLWSANGGYMAYITTSREGQTLGIASDVGELQHTIVLGVAVPFLFIPQTDTFLFIEQNTAIMMIDGNAQISQWVTGGGAFVGDIAVYPQGAVFTLLNDFSISLVYADWDDNTVHEILKMTEYPFFDAKWD